MPSVSLLESHQGKRGYRIAKSDTVDIEDILKEHDISHKNKDAVRLAIINKLLADRRPYARDHEATGEMFHGSALVKTTTGNWYVSNNIHVHGVDTTRNCAEANAVTEAIAHEGLNVKIKELYFMGGKGNYDIAEPMITPEGTVIPPCGSCLDVIQRFASHFGGETVIHMLPLNEGDLHLKAGILHDTRPPSELEGNEVFSRTIKELFPLQALVLDDSNNTRKPIIKTGYQAVMDHSAHLAVQDARSRRTQELQELTHLSELDKDGVDVTARMQVVNKVLMEQARSYYQQFRDDQKPEEMTIAIVRSDDGQYYIGKHVKNSTLQATIDAEQKAINDMYNNNPNERFTDIFVVHFSNKQLEVLNKAKDDSGITIEMPSGANREFLKKAAAQRILQQTKGFMGTDFGQANGGVHVFLPNDPNKEDFDPKRHVISLTMKELIAHPYKAPKTDRGFSAAYRDEQNAGNGINR